MAEAEEPQIPVALETVVARLGELEVILGAHVAPTLAAIQSSLITAMAARDRGDTPGAIREIGGAMDRLSALADRLDPAEAALMRALAVNFRAALLRGDTHQVQESTNRMLQRSGAVERKKS